MGVASLCRWTFTRGPSVCLIVFIVTVCVYINVNSRVHMSEISSSIPAVTSCPSLKPNLILTSVDGAKLKDQIFVFMQSLELALGRELSTHAPKHTACPPAKVFVKIITPPEFARNLPDDFKALLKRYPFLEFVGALPEIDAPVVLRRFQGFANFLGGVPTASWDKVLVCDLDVVFQRNPFNMEMKHGIELLAFAEWRGLKIGQCKVHVRWFDECSRSYMSKTQVESYKSLDRLCAGSTYGTAMAMAIYLRSMATELMLSEYKCNDQALHIHLLYSKLLDVKLTQAGLGHASIVPNEEALFGTVGTTPIVNFNEWGEVLNERGEIQYAVHQFKTHNVLSDMMWKRYGWVADVTGKTVRPIPDLLEDEKWSSGISKVHENLTRFKLGNVSSEFCGDEGSMCSCKYENCQMDYGEFEP
ncbi:hypothetical protein AJ78_04593 [Emergomyces pasteurianus Ep9510]|uniref:Uncharacterized protein n=1 Tax=Emergomyces pasteurianus Ep9510 TaxID=1447872 RepID=A0A1J9PFA2_9EURO|nr:hypothetical protein AJ78_04593 [Emergomyces pasteurianus Ep9510]